MLQIRRTHPSALITASSDRRGRPNRVWAAWPDCDTALIVVAYQ